MEATSFAWGVEGLREKTTTSLKSRELVLNSVHIGMIKFSYGLRSGLIEDKHNEVLLLDLVEATKKDKRRRLRGRLIIIRYTI